MSEVIQEFVIINNGSEFKSGELFDSYEKIMERLAIHCKQSYVYYWRRDSRTVKSVNKRISRPIEPKLIYFSMKFACVYGGQKFSSRGHGYRLSSSMRENCPAHISIRANKSGKKLEVISVCNTHNHPISKDVYEKLRQDRRLTPELKSEVIDLLGIGIDKKLIQKYVNILSGKCLTRKDLLNIGGTSKKSFESLGTNRIRSLLNKFKEVVIEGIKLDPTDNLNAINEILSGPNEYEINDRESIKRPKHKKKKKCKKNHQVHDIPDTISESNNIIQYNDELMKFSEENVEISECSDPLVMDTLDPNVDDLVIDFDSNLDIINEVTIYDNDRDYEINENLEPGIILDIPSDNQLCIDSEMIVLSDENLNNNLIKPELNELCCNEYEEIHESNNSIALEKPKIVQMVRSIRNPDADSTHLSNKYFTNKINTKDKCSNKIVKKKRTSRSIKSPAKNYITNKVVKRKKPIVVNDKCPTCGTDNKTKETIEELLREREQLYKETATLFLQCEKLKQDLILERRQKKTAVKRKIIV